MPDHVVAEQLARALDGASTGVPEADSLALLLRRAAEPARFDVPAEETERTLARLRRRPARQRRRLRQGLMAAGAAAAVALALLLALPESHTPGVNVGAQALAAIRSTGAQLEVVVREQIPSSGERLLREQWVGTQGRTRVRDLLDRTVIVDVLREPGGRVVAYQSSNHRVVVAPSCASLAGMSSELIDPIAFYRDRLATRQVSQLETIRLGGKPAYRFVLPAQRLGPGTTRVEQVVIVDAATYLPRRIVWRESHGGRSTVDAIIDVVSILPLAEDPNQVFRLSAPPHTPVVQLNALGRDLGRPDVRPISLAAARRAFPHAFWVGRSYQGAHLTAAVAYRWSSGAALLLRYGRVSVWSFDRVIPPPLLESRLLPAKEFPSGGVVARFYVAGRRLVVERDLPRGSVAVIAPESSKLQMFAIVSAVRSLA
jgi:hypothetical protein